MSGGALCLWKFQRSIWDSNSVSEGPSGSPPTLSSSISTNLSFQLFFVFEWLCLLLPFLSFLIILLIMALQYTIYTVNACSIQQSYKICVVIISILQRRRWRIMDWRDVPCDIQLKSHSRYSNLSFPNSVPSYDYIKHCLSLLPVYKTQNTLKCQLFYLHPPSKETNKTAVNQEL